MRGHDVLSLYARSPNDHGTDISPTVPNNNSGLPGNSSMCLNLVEHVDHRMGAIQTLLILVAFVFCINLHHFLHRAHFRYLGETAIFIVTGFIVSAFWTSISFDPSNSATQLDSQFFTLVLLPPIIFEVLLQLNKGRL
jgi:ABC-type phosphate transport system permease subunit